MFEDLEYYNLCFIFVKYILMKLIYNAIISVRFFIGLIFLPSAFFHYAQKIYCFFLAKLRHIVHQYLGQRTKINVRLGCLKIAYTYKNSNKKEN